MSRLDAMSDAGAASWSLAKHVMGGAAIGAGVNSVAYANGASLTNSQSFGQAALSGAAWGAAAGGVTGTAAFRKNMNINAAMRRTAAIDKNLAEQAGQPFVGPPTRMQATGSKIGHTAGDVATSIYGGAKDLFLGSNKKGLRKAKEQRLINQANRIMKRDANMLEMKDRSVDYSSSLSLLDNNQIGKAPFEYTGGIDFKSGYRPGLSNGATIGANKFSLESNKQAEHRVSAALARDRKGY